MNEDQILAVADILAIHWVKALRRWRTLTVTVSKLLT
jgi:hypothetical protein